MASKKKGTTVPLDQFLKPDTKITSWAEDEDFDADMPVSPLPTRSTAPAAEPMHDTFKSQSDLPDQPPYKVYIGNVPYELTKDDLSDVFKDLQIRDTHFLTHRDTGKLKGVFVEFSSKDGLQTALQKNGATVLGRALRIDIAEARPERSRGGYGDRDQGGYGFDRPDYVTADRGSDRSKGGGFSRDYESSDRGRGGGFGGDRGGFADRGQPDRGDRRGFGNNFDQEDRRGGSFRDRPRGDYGGFSGARDEGQGRWGREAPAPTAPAPSEALSGGPRGSDPSQLERTPSEQRSLTLQRQPSSTSVTSDTPKPKSNPFGSAKPVDTVARLKELEERDAKRKAEEAQKRREASAAAPAAAAPASAPQQPSESAPTKILKPTGRLQQPSDQPAGSAAAQTPLKQDQPPQQLQQQQPPQANGSVAAATPAAEATSPAPSAAKPEAPRAPAWGKPVHAPVISARPQDAAQQPSADAPTSPAQAEQSKSVTAPAEQLPKPASAAQQAQPQQAKQAQQPPVAAAKATQQAPVEAGKESPAASKTEKVAWGKPKDNGSAAGQAPASSQRNAWGKPKSQPAASPTQAQTQAQPESKTQTQTGASKQPEASQAGAEPQEGSKQAEEPQAVASALAEGSKEAEASPEQTATAGTTGEQSQSKAPAVGTQPTSARGGPATLPLNHRSHPRQQQQQHHQHRGQPRRPTSLASASGDAASTAPTSSGAAAEQQPDQDTAGQDAEAGRGRGPGRGRGRGRYDQDVSGGRGPADRFAGRGPGRGRGGGRYEGSRGGGRSQGWGNQYQGQDRSSQAPVAPPPGLQQDNKGGGEEGWEQSGRAGSSRNARTSARGSHTPHILQRPDKAPGAWGNANASNGASQARPPPGLVAQPEAAQSEASNPFDLLGEN